MILPKAINNPTCHVKHSKSTVCCKTPDLPALRFDNQKLTSFAGLVVIQKLFFDLQLRSRIQRCFSHSTGSPNFPCAGIILLLIVVIFLGYRRLRDTRYIEDDPLVLRVLGMNKMPHVSTISRRISTADDRSVAKLHHLQRDLVLKGMSRELLPRVTLDFDGTVTGTGRKAEGVAIGYNRKKKGQRSYYPLFCTVAQSAQVLSVLHRSGNVHDSNEAIPFIRECIEAVKNTLPQAKIETRMDGAFFSESIIDLLEELNVEYTISVPHRRYHALKGYVNQRQRWRVLSEEVSFFEKNLSLKSWSGPSRRFLFVRQSCQIQNKEPLQLDMFVPQDFDYQYKAIVTNKLTKADTVVAYHEGRGSQEGIFAEMKSQAALGYIPCNTWNANKIFVLSNVMAHNLCKELQMRHHERDRTTSAKRPALWKFHKIDTFRCLIIQRAGRLIRPRGKWTLSMATNDAQQQQLRRYLPEEVFT